MPPIVLSAPPVVVQRPVIESLQEADAKGLIDRVAALEGQLASVASQTEQVAMAVNGSQTEQCTRHRILPKKRPPVPLLKK